jgi:hypothetical protein
MDSTFMGTLAGLANRLRETGGVLQVTGADEKSRSSLEDLGLNFLMAINPEEGIWKTLEDKARDLLKPKIAGIKAGTVLHTRHILEAHEILSEANEGNQRKFSDVVGYLEEEEARDCILKWLETDLDTQTEMSLELKNRSLEYSAECFLERWHNMGLK